MVNNLALIETILRDRQAVFAEIRRGANLQASIRTMLLFSAGFLALYGGVMGSTHSVLQVLSSALKLPLLFLVTLVVCAPALYFNSELLPVMPYAYFKLSRYALHKPDSSSPSSLPDGG